MKITNVAGLRIPPSRLVGKIPAGTPFTGKALTEAGHWLSTGTFIRINTLNSIVHLASGNIYHTCSVVEDYQEYPDHELILRGQV